MLYYFRGASPEETILQLKLRLSFPVVRVTDNMTPAIKPRQHQALGHQSDLTADFRRTKDVWLSRDEEELREQELGRFKGCRWRCKTHSFVQMEIQVTTLYFTLLSFLNEAAPSF